MVLTAQKYRRTTGLFRRLCRALPFFVIGIGLGGFHSCADGVRKFRRGKEDGTVVTEFALVAPNKLRNKEPTRSIQPRPGPHVANGKLYDRRNKGRLSSQFSTCQEPHFCVSFLR